MTVTTTATPNRDRFYPGHDPQDRRIPSEKALDYAFTLVGERLVPQYGHDLMSRMNALADRLESRQPTARELSQLIDWLKTRPRDAADAERTQPEIGVYVLEDGTVVQAKPNRTKTNVYTKRWVEIRGERLVDATGEHVHGEWEYSPELKRQVRTARKMTLDEAKAFILRYGQCVRCGRKLKAAESVERGIGPVCVQYFSFS
jgi:hypothetical protein